MTDEQKQHHFVHDVGWSDGSCQRFESGAPSMQVALRDLADKLDAEIEARQKARASLARYYTATASTSGTVIALYTTTSCTTSTVPLYRWAAA